MTGRSFTNKFEEKRFMNHLINGRYEKVLILWGEETLINLIEWYQHIEMFDEVSKIIDCLKVYSSVYTSAENRVKSEEGTV